MSGLLMSYGISSLLAGTMLAAITITPTQLRTELSEPAAEHYQRQLAQLRQHSTYHGELEPLFNDPALTPAAREWLLHESVVLLRQQTPTLSAQAFVQRLTEHVPQTLLAQDFEGRSRTLPLVPLAAAAQATLRWWQQQARAQTIASQWSGDSIKAIGARWQQLGADEQAAWLLAMNRFTTEQSLDVAARLTHVDATQLAQQAPPLASALARHDRRFAAAVLRHGRDESASQLLTSLSSKLTQSEEDTKLLEAALANPTLRSQAWYVIAAHAYNGTDPRLLRAIEQGESAAVAALVQQRGEQALPVLEKNLHSKAERQQLAAVYGLRLLATPMAQQLLKAYASKPHLSARIRQELQP